jgi:hypothetical protein
MTDSIQLSMIKNYIRIINIIIDTINELSLAQFYLFYFILYFIFKKYLINNFFNNFNFQEIYKNPFIIIIKSI